MIASRLGARKLALAALVSLAALTGALAVIAPAALAARGHIFGSAFGEEGEGEGQFKEPNGIAVNEATGLVYVVDQGNNRVEYFAESGSYEGQFDGNGAPATFSEPTYVAVDDSCHLKGLSGSACTSADPSNEDVYVVDAGNNAIDKFNASGSYIGQLTEGEPGVPLSGVSGIAVDANGQLWVAYEGGGFFTQIISNFDDSLSNGLIASRELERSQGAFFEPGFAVDSEDHLYVDLGGYGAKSFVMKFDDEGKVLDETFENLPERGEVSGIAAELTRDNVYIDRVTYVQERTFSGSPVESIGAGRLTAGTGVGVNASSETVYVADASTDQVYVFVPEPPGKPAVQSESTLAVDSSSATVQAEVNPRGAATEYQFEYGTCGSAASCAVSGYEASIPATAETVGSEMDFSIYTLEEQLRGLAPDTVYHYRIVVTNTYGNVTGAERIFTTQPSGAALQLLDGRAWELVSPPNKHGARLSGLDAAGVFASSLEGGAVTYVATKPTESEPSGYASSVSVVSRRGPEGWTSKDISPPNVDATGLETTPEYQFFSSDLSYSLAYPFSKGAATALLSSKASDPTPYLRSESLCAAEGEGAEGGCYLPLATSKEPFADVVAGAEFGASYPERVAFEGATPDMRHIYLQSPVALTETPVTSGSALYEWSAERPQTEALQLISVLPEDEGGEPTFGSIGGNLNSSWSAARNSISADGSHVFWQTGTTLNGERALYLRDTVKGETIRLDVPQPEAAGGEATPWFQFASRDGSRVFFSDSELLTEGSGTGNTYGRGDLYECRIVEEGGKEACDLTDLTPETESGESAEVQNILPGAAEDGSYVYFVANGVLAEGAVPGDCESYALSTAKCNLYVYHEGRIRFIATLSILDEYDWGSTDEVFHNLGRLTAEASPDGRYLAFMSIGNLTGYDNRALQSGRPAMEVYLYDAVANRLRCISCDPTGARPSALSVGEFTGIGTSRANLAAVMGSSGEAYGDATLIAADVPHGDKLGAYGESLYQPRFVMDSGRVFFNAVSALSPQDINGDVDAYEYEPSGAGSCATSAPSYSWLDGGCVDLVSSGTAAGESAFLEASEGGANVFFLTGEQLARKDTDTAVDLYDARICTAAEPCPNEAASSPPCTSASACRKAPSSQPSLFGAPATATFSGQGNVTPAKAKPKKLARKQKLKRALARCKSRYRHNRNKRRRCVREARRRFGHAAGGSRHQHRRHRRAHAARARDHGRARRQHSAAIHDRSSR